VTDESCSVSFIGALVSAATKLSDRIRAQNVPSSDLENQLDAIISRLKVCLSNPVLTRPEEVDFFRRQLDVIIRSDGWGDGELREKALKLRSGERLPEEPHKTGDWEKVLAWLKENWMLVAAGLLVITFLARKRR
jgi:hypothetical protein